jgi:hypothetical protein
LIKELPFITKSTYSDKFKDNSSAQKAQIVDFTKPSPLPNNGIFYNETAYNFNYKERSQTYNNTNFAMK